MLFAKTPRLLTRLLIVEDEPLVAFDTEHLLREQGFEIVATVDRVAEAIAVIARGGLDLVLADVDLADGSGVEVARAAQAQALPVLFVTGNCPVGAEALAVGCLAKPYAAKDLLAAIGVIEGMTQGKRTKRVPRGMRLFG